MEEGASRALKEDEAAQRMEWLILNQHWQEYRTQNRHHGLPAGTLCQVRFQTHSTTGKLHITVRFLNTIIKRRQRIRYPMSCYWYFPGLEDEALARSERDRPETRHTSSPMRAY